MRVEIEERGTNLHVREVCGQAEDMGIGPDKSFRKRKRTAPNNPEFIVHSGAMDSDAIDHDVPLEHTYALKYFEALNGLKNVIGIQFWPGRVNQNQSHRGLYRCCRQRVDRGSTDTIKTCGDLRRSEETGKRVKGIVGARKDFQGRCRYGMQGH